VDDSLLHPSVHRPPVNRDEQRRILEAQVLSSVSAQMAVECHAGSVRRLETVLRLFSEMVHAFEHKISTIGHIKRMLDER